MLAIDALEIKFAMQAVRLAAGLIQGVQAELVGAAMTKEDRSPVTVADYASQALVVYLLSQAFPNDSLVGEEDASGLRDASARPTLELVTQFVGRLVPGASAAAVCDWIDRGSASPAERFWALDPIDGTKGFLRGDQYAVALALVIQGQVQVGVLGCPNLSEASLPEMGGEGSLVVARRGQGAWTTSLASPAKLKRLAVSKRSDPAQARLLRSFESGHTNVSQVDEFARALGVQAEPVRMDSQAKYALLASGRGDLLLRLLSPSKPDYREKIWDQAAGSLVVEEAGGQISDLHGKALNFSAGRTLRHNRGILASNGRLHSPALLALSAIGA